MARSGFLAGLRIPGNLAWIAIILGFIFAGISLFSGYGILANIFIFFASLLLLVKSADKLVEGSSNIAKCFGISSVMIGITVVAFGTSLPELTVSALANLWGSSGISIGNIIGSNISNICLVLGIAALIVPIKVNKSVFRFDFPFLIFVSALLLVLAYLTMPYPGQSGFTIGATDGIILLALFAFFMYIQVKHIGRVGENVCPILHFSFLTVAGLVGVIVSAALLVDSSMAIAGFFRVPEIIIGLTIVAVGTSLPELATNIVAALRKEYGIAVGNIIGSNIFNILLVIGTSSLIRPIQGIPLAALTFDMPVMIGVTVLLFVLMRRGLVLTRQAGILLLLIYAVYVVIRVLI
jgi:cation:H+ antiporter